MTTIQIETLDGHSINGKLVTLVDINKIARNNCKGLTYIMNVMDANSDNNTCYMWLKDDDTNISYLVEI